MSDRRISWVAWRVEDAGGVRTTVTFEGPGGLEREERAFESLETAAERFGPGFLEVARKVVASGSRSGRWRP